MIPARVTRRFAQAGPVLDHVAQTVRETVLGYCEGQGFAYTGRKKTLESLAEKLETGRFEKWSDLDDLFGCCVVIPTLAGEGAVLEFLTGAFDCVRLQRRGTTQKPPESFRFEATRFYGRLKPVGGPDFNDPNASITFEVQIRTAFEHAWSVTTHAIYKSSEVSWKTKRLAAQLKAAVEQLDSLVLAFGTSAEPIVEHAWPDIAFQAETVDKLSSLIASGHLREEMAPKDWSRFAENLGKLIRSSRNYSRHTQARLQADSVAAIVAEINGFGRDNAPLVLSLFQITIGVLARERLLVGPLHHFVPVITEELTDIYPATRDFLVGSFLFDA